MTRKQSKYIENDPQNTIASLLGGIDDEVETKEFDVFGKRRRGSSDPLVQLCKEQQEPEKK